MQVGELITMAAHGDNDLEKLVEAAASLENKTKVNEQLSVLLDTTIEDVVNRKKRLTRRYYQLVGEQKASGTGKT